MSVISVRGWKIVQSVIFLKPYLALKVTSKFIKKPNNTVVLMLFIVKPKNKQ